MSRFLRTTILNNYAKYTFRNTYTETLFRDAVTTQLFNGGNTSALVQRSTRGISTQKSVTMAHGEMTQKRAEAVECTHHWENMLEDGSRRYREFKKGTRDGGRVTEQHRSEESEEMEVYSSEGEDGMGHGEAQPMKEAYMKARRGQKRGSEGVETGSEKKRKDDGGEKRMVRELY
ncbi:hypothetical protein BU16DRAFT_558513 [Lophium mytilinum]|uniref:Uncharacterized protein n=1 Tax=Lophium mytilinum TaxID=390894 RepID=A0A6A6R3X5_9PEZI|nr:hypothetical protein BU16DRAFT_558513 [Lophium mytilinum]